MLSAGIVNETGAVGKVEICYTEEKPELDVSPFLNEERILIDAIGILPGDFIKKHKVETVHIDCVGGVEQVILFPESWTAN
jgi:SHS2 domain-containing protein